MDTSFKAGYSTPMLHVAEIEKSIRFYELLGFTLINTDDCKPLGWARIECVGGALMFLRAEHPIDPKASALMLVMYTPDLAGLRDHLIANHVEVSEINHPPYAQAGECNCKDPDGNHLVLIHWGKKENDDWVQQLKDREPILSKLRTSL